MEKYNKLIEKGYSENDIYNEIGLIPMVSSIIKKVANIKLEILFENTNDILEIEPGMNGNSIIDYNTTFALMKVY